MSVVEEQIGDTPVPHVTPSVTECVAPEPSAIAHVSHASGLARSAPLSAIEHVAPVAADVHATPATVIEQVALVMDYVTPAAADAAPIPVIGCTTPASAVADTTPVLVNDYATSSPVIEQHKTNTSIFFSNPVNSCLQPSRMCQMSLSLS